MLDVVVVWLGRDLRLHDNPALSAALLTARKVVVAYIWAPEEEGQFQPGRASRWWLYHSLRALEQQVEARGSFICYRRGPCAVEQLLEICRDASASVVYFNNVYDPLSLIRDHEVKRQLSSAGIVSRNFNAELLFEPWAVLDDDGSPLTTFDEFWNRMSHMVPAAPSFGEPSIIPSPNDTCLRRLRLDDLGLISSNEKWAHAHFADKWTPGTKAGLMLLVDFLDNRLPDFEENRAKVDRDSTSRLSPYIHFGEVSVRVIYHEVKQRESTLKSGVTSSFLKQLGYREYSRYLSIHFPFTHERSLLEHVRAVPWLHCPVRFKAWRQGMTGYPIVDAAMRQLWVAGWMHNRARVFTASFLVKNLLLPWQWGLKHFWDMLLDADLECDALGWQYVAGCLRDAHPFTYLMDFETESKRFDPDGAFVRKWVPELAQMPLQYIHHPWDAPKSVLEKAGLVLGVAYPCPITSVAESRAAVDHAYGVVQKCMYIRSVNPEPFQLPTVPIKIDILEPEDEVDQMLGAAGVKSASQHGEHCATALRSGAQAQMLLAPAVVDGVMLRKEQIPPSCVLPELPDVCNWNQRTSSTDASQRASCGHSQDGEKSCRRSRDAFAARSESQSNSASGVGASCSYGLLGAPSTSQLQQPTCSQPGHVGQLTMSLREKDRDRESGEFRGNGSCATNQLGSYCHSGDCTDSQQEGLAQPVAMQQGEFAKKLRRRAEGPHLDEPKKEHEASGSESTCTRRQPPAATDSPCAANPE